MAAGCEQAQLQDRLRALHEEAEQTLTDAGPERILEWIDRNFGERAGVSCSFGGPGGIVLAHLATRWAPRSKILFIDTGFLFPETYALRERLESEWKLHILTGEPALTPARQEEIYGPKLWERDPDLCCRLRKVEPMARLLKAVDCWVTALRRDQSATRAGIRRFELHQVRPDQAVLKVNPLAGWSRADVWNYVYQHKLPYNPLLDQGYASLGCIHCTAPAQSDDERAGRWQGKNKTECGLHTFTRRTS